MVYRYTHPEFKKISSISRQIRMKIKNQGYATCFDFLVVTDQYNEEMFTNTNYKFYGWNVLRGFKIDKTADGRWELETPEIVEVSKEINEYKKRRKNDEFRYYE